MKLLQNYAFLVRHLENTNRRKGQKEVTTFSKPKTSSSFTAV